MRPAHPLTPSWVAGSVRARQMLGVRIGSVRARRIAASPSLEDALAALTGTAYGRSVRIGMDLADAQRAIAETALWHVRVLVGWAPPRAVEAVRALTAWFELANIEDRLAYTRGGAAPAPFQLGGLATGWARLAGAQTVADVRSGLGASAWGDPGTDDPGEIALALRMAWAARVLDAVEEAEAWAAGAVALVLARELLLARRPPADLPAHRVPGVGATWPRATSVASLRKLLPPRARWALEDIEGPSELWEAEAAWWRRVESDADVLARSALLGRPAVIGGVVLLGVDAWRTAAALEVAARGGGGAAMEAFERIA